MTRKTKKTMSEAEVVATLQRLEKRWPTGLMLFSDGTLRLMRCKPDGTPSHDRSDIIESFCIPSDGGDPW